MAAGFEGFVTGGGGTVKTVGAPTVPGGGWPPGMVTTKFVTSVAVTI